MQFTISVPASSANLGPGYDALGIALNIRDDVSFIIEAGAGLHIETKGYGAETLSSDSSNLVASSFYAQWARLIPSAPSISLCIRVRNDIPMSGGLGSSAAAIIAGTAAATAAAHRTCDLDPDVLLDDCLRIEHHADNLTAAIFGGCTVAYRNGNAMRHHALPCSSQITPVLLVPTHLCVPTAVSRSVVPELIPMSDSSFSTARAALLGDALRTADDDLLFDATEDRTHQQYRAEKMRESFDMIHVLRERGIPACLSGAGPTVLSLTTPERMERIPSEAFSDIGWKILTPSIDMTGVRIHAVDSAQPIEHL